MSAVNAPCEDFTPLSTDFGTLTPMELYVPRPDGAVIVKGRVIPMGECAHIDGMYYENTGREGERLGLVAVHSDCPHNARDALIATATESAMTKWGKLGAGDLDIEPGTYVPCKVDDPIGGLIYIAHASARIQIRWRDGDGKINYTAICNEAGMLLKLTPF
jgi:hypothetical protein